MEKTHTGKGIGDIGVRQRCQLRLTGEPADHLPSWNTMFKPCNSCTAESDCPYKQTRKGRAKMSNEYELSFTVKGVGGVIKERSESASETNSRELLRAKYGKEVQIISGRQTRFGERDDDRRDGNR